MSLRSCVLVLVALLPATAGCALKETNAQLEEIAYLSFGGDADGAKLQIDGGEELLDVDTGNVRYEVAPGARRVSLWRSGQLILDRRIFVSRGETFRITVP